MPSTSRSPSGPPQIVLEDSIRESVSRSHRINERTLLRYGLYGLTALAAVVATMTNDAVPRQTCWLIFAIGFGALACSAPRAN